MLGALILGGLLLYFLYYNFVEKRKNLPPGPTPLPLFGNLLSLGQINQTEPIKKWSQKYGPVFTLWIGCQPNVVITDYEIMKETLVKQGEAFAGRPEHFIYDDMRGGHQYGMVTNDGEIWKQQRRFALHVFRDFGFGRQIMEKKIIKEAEKLISNIEELLMTSGGKPVDVLEPLELCVANVISSVIMGHTLEKERKFKELKNSIQTILYVLSTLQGLLLGQYPWLRFIPLFDHFGYDRICGIRKEFFHYINREIEEHKTHFDSDAEATDYTAAFLKEMQRRTRAGEDLEGFTMWQLNQGIFDIWVAGMKTTFTTLKWALLYLVHFPEVQEKCFNEIFQILNNRESKMIKMADKNDTPFLAATIAEIQRHVNLLPLNMQHRLTKDAILNGFSLPKGVAILPQISAVMSDERYFSSPEKFDPWRFISDDGKTLKSLEHVIPFSIGKRACLGESLARMELFLIFGTLIQKYKFSAPDGDHIPSLETMPGFFRTPCPFRVSLEKRNY